MGDEQHESTEKQNIRDHARLAVEGGMPAELAVVDGAPGVLFHDEGEFIPFSDLGYNSEIGYFRLSQASHQLTVCDNANPQTIHRGDFWHGDWQPPPWVWLDDDGNAYLLGEAWQAADLMQALHAALVEGVYESEVIDEDDPAWGRSITTARAVEEAIMYDPTVFPPGSNVAERIRRAAQRGQIPGARKAGGEWRFSLLKFRGWLRNEEAHRPGPRLAAEEKL